MRGRRGERGRMWSTGFLVVAATVTSCGGPAFPAELPASSAASPRAEAAPLPRLGSSFEDAPLGEEETRPMDHRMHGGAQHGEMPAQPSGGMHGGMHASPDPSAEGQPDHGGHQE